MHVHFEHDNLIIRGEAVVNGRWQVVSSKTLMDAGFHGQEMTEQTAKAFLGEGWAEENN